MKKLLTITAFASLLIGGTYDYSYSTNSEQNKVDTAEAKNFFMYGDFEEIVRFNSLVEDEDNSEKLEEISKQVKKYVDDEKDIRVKIIGHTNEPTDDVSERIVNSKTYANKIQDLFRDELDTNRSIELSKSYAQNTQKELIDLGVDEALTVVEYRGGDDIEYTDLLEEGRDLSNRVMVTIYVVKKEDKDSDNDGVLDSKDKCPKTPAGVVVDENGCQLDSDKDGVLDAQDKCPETPVGLVVDKNGCRTMKILKLNFANDSSVIKEDSMQKVQDFAQFLKDNVAYDVKVVGHTDSNGKVAYNEKLSKNRAASVKEALVKDGVDSSRITTDGLGESNPLADNNTAAGRKENRRIEAILTLNN